MTDIIQQLKKNKEMLILMDSELRDVMLSMDHADFLCLQDTSTIEDLVWRPVEADKWYVAENLYNTVRLRPDYANESEIEECRIRENNAGGCLVFERRTHEGEIARLDCCIDDPDFIGFKFEDGGVGASPLKYSDGDHEGVLGQFYHLAKGTNKVLHATHVLFRRQK